MSDIGRKDSVKEAWWADGRVNVISNEFIESAVSDEVGEVRGKGVKGPSKMLNGKDFERWREGVGVEVFIVDACYSESGDFKGNGERRAHNCTFGRELHSFHLEWNSVYIYILMVNISNTNAMKKQVILECEVILNKLFDNIMNTNTYN